MLGCLAVGFGAFVLHCFMSHHWLGRARTNSVPCVGPFAFRTPVRRGLLTTFSAAYASLNVKVEVVRDGKCGSPSFVNFT